MDSSANGSGWRRLQFLHPEVLAEVVDHEGGRHFFGWMSESQYEAMNGRPPIEELEDLTHEYRHDDDDDDDDDDSVETQETLSIPSQPTTETPTVGERFGPFICIAAFWAIMVGGVVLFRDDSNDDHRTWTDYKVHREVNRACMKEKIAEGMDGYEDEYDATDEAISAAASYCVRLASRAAARYD